MIMMISPHYIYIYYGNLKDAPLRIFLALNLRDSTAEDNVRKRPFYQ